ncbi:MAG TPA: C25 family cysteine peptidase [Thermoanaerobaculia bacterium]|nr:C25 family cysteine peptidase [Thermoanaerobaculia bacterium]
MLWPTLSFVSRSLARTSVLLAFSLLALLPGVFPLQAASTGQTALFTPQGSAAGNGNGDYVTSTAGLNTFYRYFIEVPPGLGHLVVEIFDADVGRGGNTEDTAGRDRDRDGNGFDATATYTLLRPDGSTAATLNCTAASCTDNGWQALLDSTTAQNTAAGHWELRVAMSGSTNINAIGIRAHDGTSGAGGTELNVYYDSHSQFGVNPPATGNGTRSYAVYPYLTSGCSAAKNDFDYDSNNGNTGSINLTSRTAAFTQNYASTSLSTTSNWRRDTFSGWTSDTKSADYGIWSAAITINTYTVNGAVNGNYANVYFSNFQAAANPPTANPTPNAFRVYLPTDAGTAPVKPYLEQLATYSGCGAGNDGPNPPAANQRSCFTVTVRMVNPTVRAITFSNTNLVTANVPGSGAVYGGGAQASQGSIVSQPAVNGTGNVTWNPGTLAAGATALLSYHVLVTPTMLRTPLTATPASGNGTRAQYVDETGNTTQGRATFLFGPLCELAVTEGLLTEAVVSSFTAAAAPGGGVLVSWRTTSEAGTAGFYLKRWNGKGWEPVHRELLTGLLHAPQGGVYRYLDGGASPRQPQVYLLEEVEAGGKRRNHGPFAVTAKWDRSGDAADTALAYERQAGAAPGRSSRPAGSQALFAPVAVASAPNGLHLSVPATGLYYLRTADLAPWFGLTAENLGKQIAKGNVALSRGGQPVAWMPDLPPGSGDRPAAGVFFYGQAPATLYEAASTYKLERAHGVLMQTASAGTPTGTAAASFPESLHTEQNVLPATLISPDPESDYWFWQFLQGDDPSFGSRTFSLDAPGLAAGQAATLGVSLFGATASGVAGEHNAAVAVNGTAVGETSWQGIAPQQASFAVPAGVLQAAGNQVLITAHTGAGAPFSIYYLNSFDLSYPRLFRAAGDALAFSAAGATRVTVTGFTNPAIDLLEVSDPLHPRWITGATVGPDGAGGFQLAFAPAGAGPYLAAALAALRAVTDPRPWNTPSLRSAANRGNYLVIAPAALHGAAGRLAALRQAQGLEARVVDLEAVYDEFAFGVATPHALHDFLTYAWQSWSLKPGYVALAGAGTFDYRNLLGFGDDLVPPLMIRTPNGLFPSDNLLGDVDGDGLPEMAVGRLPVLSAAELDAYTNKISAYEAAAGAAWNGNALFLADSTENGADFAADSAGVATQLPAGYTVEEVDLTSVPLATARSLLFAGLASGEAFLDYLGHGALDRLSSEGLLTTADVPNLTNGERLPVLTAMTCTINRFAVPGVPTLGELLVNGAAGGAAAVWGPSALSDHGNARLLATRFYHATDDRLGDRLLRAIAEYRTLGGDPTLPPVYVLLGDPALRLKTPVPPALTPAGQGE